MTQRSSSSRGKRSAGWWCHLLGGACCVGIAAIGYAVGVGPLLGAQKERTAQRDELLRQEELATQTAATLGELQGQWSRMDLALRSFDRELSPASELNQRLTVITGLAARSGVGIHAILPQAPILEGRYQAIPIRFSGVGAFASWTKFLRGLHENVSDVAVVAFELDSDFSSSDSAQPRFALQLVWHAAPSPPGQTAQAAEAVRP